jgi:hypothetical protein
VHRDNGIITGIITGIIAEPLRIAEKLTQSLKRETGTAVLLPGKASA